MSVVKFKRIKLESGIPTRDHFNHFICDAMYYIDDSLPLLAEFYPLLELLHVGFDGQSEPIARTFDSVR